MCKPLLTTGLVCLASIFANAPASAQSISVVDPLSVCFSDIYRTQIQTSSDVDSKSAVEIASDSASGNSHSGGMSAGASYGPFSGSYGQTSADSYTNSLKTLNKNAFSDRELHSYVMKTLTPQALASLDHCMDAVNASLRGTTTVWPQITSDPRRVVIHVKFVPGDNPSQHATIDLAKSDGEKCEVCTPLELGGSATKDFTLWRDDASKPMLAEIHVGNSDKTIDIDGYRDLKFVQPAASPCLLAPRIVKVSGPRNQDGQSRAKNGNFDPAIFPTRGFSSIGWLVEPSQDSFPADQTITNVVLHDHRMTSPHVPDVYNATIEYEFSQPVAVTQIEVVQHTNGLNRLHAWLTDTPGDYSHGDLGAATRPWQGLGAIPEGQDDVFIFPHLNPAPIGRYLKVTIEGTAVDSGWAVYRMFPRDQWGTRILPAATCDSSSGTVY